MPRKPELERQIKLNLSLPETLRARVDLHLFSTLESRVPQGKYQEFFASRIREFFEHRRLDLAPFGFAQGYFVQGPKEMIEELERRLRA